MVVVGKQPPIISPDVFKELETLPEYLDDYMAQVSLARFLRYNIGFAWELFQETLMFPFQEIILNAWFKKTYSLFVAARGLGKCIDQNSYILAKSGFKKIKDIEVGEEVYTKNRFCKVLAKTTNPEEDGFTVRTRQKFFYTGKIGHKTYIFNPTTLGFDYKNIEDISTDDIIPIKYGMNHFGSHDIQKGFAPNYYQGAKNKKFNLIVNEDFYYLLGLITGDGCLRGTGISISTADGEILNSCKSIVGALCPLNKQQIHSKEDNLASNFIVSNKVFKDYLSHIGFDTRALAHEKKIPIAVQNSKKEYLKSYLQGLFDTDGGISVEEKTAKNSTSAIITFSSSSEELAYSVQRILLNFGIVSAIRLHRKAGKAMVMGRECDIQNSYELYITSKKFISKFRQEIGFRLSRKQRLLDHYLESIRKSRDYNSNLIPVGDYLIRKYGGCYAFRKAGYGKIHRNVSEERIKFLVEKDLIDDEDKARFVEILNNWVFLPVKSIEKCRTTTIDIQVEHDECYWSDGIIHHNSYLLAQFCILYAIFYPKSEIVIISANFRAAKNVFKKIEDFIKNGKKNLLKSSFPKEMSRQADRYVLECSNGSQIIGLPLSGEGLRGQRANVLIIDEGLLVSKEVQTSVLKPFIVANLDLTNQNKIRELENQLIEEGHMGEDDRTVFDRNKLIICSSASYQFEHLYEGIYQPNIEMILNKHSGKKNDPSYFVCRSSYHIGLKHGIIDDSIIQDAESMGRADDPAIKREYWAEFTDASGGYFNIKLAKECQFKDGETPTLKLYEKGKEKQFILTIDPSYASNKESDFFAMGVYQLNVEERKITLVHSYGRAGGELTDHYEYLIYLLTHFNIVWICIDATGTDGQFIKEFNESALAKEHNIRLGFVDVDFEVDDSDYHKSLMKARSEWNLKERKIVYKHIFGSGTNRKTNEYLSSQLGARKIWFGSKINMNETEHKKYNDHFKMPFIFRDKMGRIFGQDENGHDPKLAVQEFIDAQDAWIDETIGQVALIQITPTESGGGFRYDLPQYLRRSKDANRQRKDNYTCLLLGAYSAKHVFDMLGAEEETYDGNFVCIGF